jgi:hypothetical protein
MPSFGIVGTTPGPRRFPTCGFTWPCRSYYTISPSCIPTFICTLVWMDRCFTGTCITSNVGFMMALRCPVRRQITLRWNHSTQMGLTGGSSSWLGKIGNQSRSISTIKHMVRILVWTVSASSVPTRLSMAQTYIPRPIWNLDKVRAAVHLIVAMSVLGRRIGNSSDASVVEQNNITVGVTDVRTGKGTSDQAR